MRVRLRHCRVADRDHRLSRRSYAHVFHIKGFICIARAFDELPELYRVGILLHEIGHLEIGEVWHSEAHADRFGSFASGVRIHRRDSQYGRALEVIEARDLAAADEFLAQRITRYRLINSR